MVKEVYLPYSTTVQSQFDCLKQTNKQKTSWVKFIGSERCDDVLYLLLRHMGSDTWPFFGTCVESKLNIIYLSKLVYLKTVYLNVCPLFIKKNELNITFG